MTVFVDTSAFYAVLDRDDANHAEAKNVWTRLVREGTTFLTSNYVLVETAALLQHRLGMAAVRSCPCFKSIGFLRNAIVAEWKPCSRPGGKG
jgi:predicted nucleic acid-binding protein